MLNQPKSYFFFQDNYLDAYINVIQDTDPLKTSLVFSCGMGAVRTTYAMVAACIVRRKRVMELGWPDPFGSSTFAASTSGTPVARSNTPLGTRSGSMTVCIQTSVSLEVLNSRVSQATRRFKWPWIRRTPSKT